MFPSMLSHSIVTIEFLFKLLRPISWQRNVMEKGFVLGHNSRLWVIIAETSRWSLSLMQLVTWNLQS